jgi:hypothetical protein
MNSQSRKIHNPKSHAPAVYIPCWLIQVPQHELSHLAKILYGRLAQWSNTKGVVSRSAPELAVEMGCHSRVIERGLKELRDIGLIETYQVHKGGVNSFIFLDHELMYRPLQDCLDYYEQHTPVDNSKTNDLPPDKNVGTPPTKMSVPPDKNVGLKYKEIKEIKKSRASGSDCLKTTSKNLTPIPVDFVPDEKSHEMLWKTAERVKMPPNELLIKFLSVSTKYKTKSADWQATFIEFLERERPKRTFEDANGKLKRYDGGNLHY